VDRRQAILACRDCGTVSIIGVYAGWDGKLPMRSFRNRSLTLKTGQCHVQRYLKLLLGQAAEGSKMVSSKDAPAWAESYRSAAIADRFPGSTVTTGLR
jgi:threonine dehydrogenase-like Zn-dependent dehydrogenase